MTDVQIRAAHRLNAALLRQSREKAHDLLLIRKANAPIA